jgi:predicted ATPase
VAELATDRRRGGSFVADRRGDRRHPLFVRETMRRVLDRRDDGDGPDRWPVSIEEIGIAEGVREVIGRRIARLPDPAVQLLATASGCAGEFRFEVVAAAARLAEDDALDALDAALDAGLVVVNGLAESYGFSHALVRHALYTDLSPSRQLRLHRRLAETMAERFAADPASHAFEIAMQWHRSAPLAGAEHGVAHCIAAADKAAAATAHEDEATALRMALDLAAAADPRRPRLWRASRALAYSLATEEAVRVRASRRSPCRAGGRGRRLSYKPPLPCSVRMRARGRWRRLRH